MDRILDNEGTRIWSTARGRGIPLILCNGGPGCDDYLGPVATLVEDVACVVRFEPRGCGRSDRDGRYDLDTMVADIEFVRQAYELPKIIIGGHSAGVDSALAYAIKYPDKVIGLLGIAGGRVVNDREWSRVYHENLEKRGEDTGGKAFLADPEVNRVGNASWREFIRRPNLLRDLATLQVPAVFINAGADIRPNWPTQQLASLLPQGRYVEIAGAGHYIWLTHATELGRQLHGAISGMRHGQAREGGATEFPR